MTETELEMARRHVRRGRELILRQRRALASFEQDGNERLIASARSTLNIMLALQKSFEAHLTELEGNR
jgi:hypothetical protein